MGGVSSVDHCRVELSPEQWRSQPQQLGSYTYSLSTDIPRMELGSTPTATANQSLTAACPGAHISNSERYSALTLGWTVCAVSSCRVQAHDWQFRWVTVYIV